MTAPKCLGCDEGFAFNDNGECVATTSSPTTVDVSCSDFDHCLTYNDGCNNCHCHENGAAVCTMMWCSADAMTTPRCNECEEGFIVTADGECVAAVSSSSSTTTSSTTAA